MVLTSDLKLIFDPVPLASNEGYTLYKLTIFTSNTYTDLGEERGRKNNKVNITEVIQYEKCKGSILISNIIGNDVT